MSTDNAAHNLATPRRSITPMQMLSSLFRTPTRLRTPTTTLEFVSRHRNKRTRSSTLSSPSSQPTPPSTLGTNLSLPAVVLQTYSVSTDSIVLTSLPSVPFCCHEDLLTMSRTQLEGVVRALNTRLPRRMWIGPDTEDDFWGNDAQNERPNKCDSDKDEEEDGLSRMSEAEMRRHIEELVGIRAIVGKNRVSKSGLGLHARTGGVPPAPKAVRTRGAAWRPYDKVPWEEVEVDAIGEDSNITIGDAMMGSSPLASRTMSGARAGGKKDASRLAILQEENEGSDSQENDSDDSERRPSKRQRISSGSVARSSGEERQSIQGGRQSTLIENMDVSGSPLLAEDDDNTAMAVARTENRENRAITSEGSVEGPLQRRRSARIKEIGLKRTSSVDRRKKISLDASNLKSSILRSRTLSCSSRTNSASEATRDPSTSRECTIRLPFTTTSPPQKSNPLAWSTPRILRSQSRRLSNSNELTKTEGLLGRSQSERYPRAADMDFVTINRPRYCFARGKSKGSETAKGEQEISPSASVSPARAIGQVQQDIRIRADHSDEKREDEKENQEPKIATKNSGAGGLYSGTLSSAFYSFLAPRSRAPSTSTITSTRSRGNGGDPPADTGAASATIRGVVVVNGPAEHVSDALGRMVVD